MTNQEWKNLCREIKNEGGIHMLYKSILRYTNENMIDYKRHGYVSYYNINVQEFITHYQVSDIKNWYIDYYKTFIEGQ